MRARVTFLVCLSLLSAGGWLALRGAGRPAEGDRPPPSPPGRYQLFQQDRDLYLLDTTTGKVWVRQRAARAYRWGEWVEPPKR
jgi:hypothetical protein